MNNAEPVKCAWSLSCCFALLTAVALFQMWPWYFFPVNIEKHIYQFFMQCFAHSLGEGNLRPDWCGPANGGLGSPAFIFYFPLSFYFSSLFYPLKLLGVTTNQLFTFVLILANIFNLHTLFLWLSRHATNKAACIITILCAWIPYRLEVLFYNSDYPQLFAMGFFPLCLIGMERFLANRRNWKFLCVMLAFSALAHVMITIIAATIIGLYILFYTKSLRACGVYIMIGACAVCLISYQLIPAYYYEQFVWGHSGTNDGALVNRYLQLRDFKGLIIIQVLLAGMNLLIVAGLCYALYTKRAALKPHRNLTAWLWTSLVSLAIFSPIIAPIYDNSQLFRTVFFPWRLQLVYIPLIAVLLLALQLTPLSIKEKNQRRVTLGLSFFFLLILQAFNISGKAMTEPARTYVVEQMIAPLGEYQSKWSMVYIGWSKTEELFNKFINQPEYKLDSGNAKVTTIHRSDHRWQLNIKAEQPSTIILNQTYFPSWRAYSADGSEIALTPGSDGKTMLHAPKGNHEIVLYHRLYAYAPWWVAVTPFISLLLLGYFVWSGITSLMVNSFLRKKASLH